MSDNRRFQRGSGVYTCYTCERETRDTGKGEGGLGLCAGCYEIMSIENMHSDDGHDGEVWDCDECKAQMSSKAQAHLSVYRAAMENHLKAGDEPPVES